MQFSEPVTMLTDYGIACFCVFFALQLKRENQRRFRTSVSLWSVGFMVAGVSAIVGGTYHGFLEALPGGVRWGLWNLTVFLIGLTGGFFVSGFLCALPARKSAAARWLLAGTIVTGCGFAVQQSRAVQFGVFNWNDVYHLIQIGGFYLFYRGALLLEDKRPTAVQ